MAKKDYQGGQILTDSISGLKKTRFTLMGMMFFIYCACAGGCFGIESMISSSGPGITLVLLVAIPLLWGLPMGLYSSEMTCLMPVETGPYVWPKQAFGEFWGFSFGWWMAVVWFLTGPSYVVLATDYIGMYISLTPVTAFLVKAAIIVFCTIINIIGLEGVSRISTIFTIIILLAFVSVAAVGIANWQYNPFEPFMADGENAMANWGTGIAIGIWMYCGYVVVSNMGGELENPEMLPRGMKWGILLITLSYILPTLGGIVSTGPWYEWGNTIDYSSVLFQHVGQAAGIAFMVVAVIANIAIFNPSMTAASRSFMVLAEDNLSPKFLSKLSKKNGTPLYTILICAIVNLILVNFDFEILVTIMSPGLFVIYGGLSIAYVKLRRDYPVEKRKGLYFVKGGKLAELYICGGPMLLGVIGILVNGTEYFLLGFVLILSAIVMYVIIKLIYGGRYKNDPELYPINPKTRMAKGDLWRFGIFFLIFGTLAFLGSFFLMWYEGDWGPAYYLETYGSGLMSNFYLMVSIARWLGVGMLIAGIVLFFVGRKIDPAE